MQQTPSYSLQPSGPAPISPPRSLVHPADSGPPLLPGSQTNTYYPPSQENQTAPYYATQPQPGPPTSYYPSAPPPQFPQTASYSAQPQPGMQAAYYQPQAPSGPPVAYYSTQPGHQQGGQMQPVQIQMAQPGPGQAARGPPQPRQWMGRPAMIPNNCPPGLEYLTQIDQILVKQEVEAFEMITGFETCNRYRVLNTMGQQIFYAMEESEAFERMAYGSFRSFTIHVIDNARREVIRVVSGQSQQVTIFAPVGVIAGFVDQPGCFWNPNFIIYDASRTPVFRIHGPNAYCSCDQEFDYKVTNYTTGGVVGHIVKQWSGWAQEMYTDADNFAISFPMDLDVGLKAVMLGALFLMDFMFFEDDNAQPNRHQHNHYGSRYY